MNRILLVCIGNICRSPMAQAVMARRLPHYVIDSAGLDAMIAHPADPLAVDVTSDQGFPIIEHRAQQITNWMCNASDLILVMDRAQKAAVEQQFPQSRGKVFLLGHYLSAEIADPYGQDKKIFGSTLDLIVQSVDRWIPRIEKIN